MNVKINIAEVSCPTCSQPVLNVDKARGIKINEIARLGAKLAEIRSKKPSDLRNFWIETVEAQLRELGATVDEDGFVKSNV